MRRLEKDMEPEYELAHRVKGTQITCRVWRIKRLEGCLDWEHARQLFRIERAIEKSGQEPEVGNRYFVTNLACGRLGKPTQWIDLVRLCWRCENENHWTADVFFDEDATRTPWTTDPEAVYVMSFLRTLGLNILAVLPSMCLCEYTRAKLPWKEIILRVKMTMRTANAEEQRRSTNMTACPKGAGRQESAHQSIADARWIGATMPPQRCKKSSDLSAEGTPRF